MLKEKHKVHLHESEKIKEKTKKSDFHVMALWQITASSWWSSFEVALWEKEKEEKAAGKPHTTEHDVEDKRITQWNVQSNDIQHK